MLIHDGVESAMLKIYETDNKHGYWVITFYAKRDHIMHSGVLNQRYEKITQNS